MEGASYSVRPIGIVRSRLRAIRDAPAALWRIADLRLHLPRHPAGDEALESRRSAVDDAECRVMASCHLRCGLYDALQHAVESQLGIDRDSCLRTACRGGPSPGARPLG
jgi:hypothetical protein